ncbi:MBL fold metallo-hydrolase [Streptomyces carpinensis]|uniref:MBL fold metallo-hydrolase n=1 Tax=Streptomyces carpinensis TaxID=66369 RepID=A0ABV1WJ71_9ACTN|nr:MBL fold metallo-hydrolase [Streptomyces carpinensis]
MGKLNQVADGVWVRQSEWVWSNSIAARGEDGLILIDPGIDGSELNRLADDVDRLGIPVVAGFSTHPHWDHLLPTGHRSVITRRLSLLTASATRPAGSSYLLRELWSANLDEHGHRSASCGASGFPHPGSAGSHHGPQRP